MTLMCSIRRSCWRCAVKEMGRNDGELVLELAKKEETITCADAIALLHISSTIDVQHGQSCFGDPPSQVRFRFYVHVILSHIFVFHHSRLTTQYHIPAGKASH